MDLPREFATLRGGERGGRAIVVRPGLDVMQARPLLERVAAVSWSELYHAYGPADDVPAQLAAVFAGDEGTREEARWNLWGNIHHQGTIYEATVPAVAILLGLARWREHPDRSQALALLREIGAADGVNVWRFAALGRSGLELSAVAGGRRRDPRPGGVGARRALNDECTSLPRESVGMQIGVRAERRRRRR